MQFAINNDNITSTEDISHDIILNQISLNYKIGFFY